MSDYAQLLDDLDAWAIVQPDAADAIRTLLRERDEARAEAKRYLDCLIWVQHRISQAKIWGGMGWHWNPLHPAHYKPAIERIDAALAGGNEQETRNE